MSSRMLAVRSTAAATSLSVWMPINASVDQPIRSEPGDAVAVVANADLARKEFGWVPELDDLDRIVSDALSWERILATKNWPNRAGP